MKKIDEWQLGCVIVEMLTLKPISDFGLKLDHETVIQKILPEVESHHPIDFGVYKMLIESLLHEDAGSRMSLEELEKVLVDGTDGDDPIAEIIQSKEARVFLMGATTSGKTSLINNIFQTEIFQTGVFGSETKELQYATAEVKPYRLTFVDTPGFLDDHGRDSQFREPILKELVINPPNCILIVTKFKLRPLLATFVVLERLKEMNDKLPYNLFSRAIIVFTHCGNHSPSDKEPIDAMAKIRQHLAGEKVRQADIAQKIPFQMVESDLRCKNVRVLKDGTLWLQELLKAIVSVSDVESSFVISRFLDPIVLRSGALQVFVAKASAPGRGVPLSEVYKNYKPDTEVLNWVYDAKPTFLNKVINKVVTNEQLKKKMEAMVAENANVRQEKKSKNKLSILKKKIFYLFLPCWTMMKCFIRKEFFRLSGEYNLVNKLEEDLKRASLKEFKDKLNEVKVHEKISLLKRVIRHCAPMVSDIWFTDLQDLLVCVSTDAESDNLAVKKKLAKRIKTHFALLSNYNLFYRILKFLQKVVAFKDKNLMTADNLAIVLIPNLFQLKTETQHQYAPVFSFLITYYED